MSNIRITRYASFMAADPKEPRLEWADKLFRRRLSLLSRMTCQVIYDLLPVAPNEKITFLSFRGEIVQQFNIYDMIFNDEIRPAAFSSSVFNNAPAQASIALSLRAGYTAIYPCSFYSGFTAAAAPLLSGEEEKTIFVYADENPPPEYEKLCTERWTPFAFAAELSRSEGASVIRIEKNNSSLLSAENFLSFLNKNKALK
ncbi:hypothetical protein AGMMS50212_04570 [Spirochaetia bacterium]|nr:hypothetical protein AGMMS50212_04570 [Spirochaetia bacterium]